MTIEFLDLRVSEQSESDANFTIIPLTATPLTFGDIGLQIAGVSPANAGNVRVQLWGYAKVNVAIALTTVTITVFKNGSPIFTTSATLGIGVQQPIGFSTTDFPVPADFATGQIQYTAQISVNVLNVATVAGARNFSGMAAAGNFSG